MDPGTRQLQDLNQETNELRKQRAWPVAVVADPGWPGGRPARCSETKHLVGRHGGAETAAE